jgi:hypothetical protein
MKQIRAFLFYPDVNDNWACKVFREFEPLIEAAITINSNGKFPVAIHVGFEQPDITGIEELLAEQNRFVYLSTSAIGAMPSNVRISSLAVGTLKDTSFYLALNGFGYETSESSESKEDIENPISLPNVMAPKGWVFLVKQKPDLFKKLVEIGIWDDNSYLENEDKLDLETRFQVGLLRFQLLEDHMPSGTIILDQLRSTPPWLLETSIVKLDLTVRSFNVFKNNEIRLISDLIKFGSAGLTRLPNLGRRSINEISEAIVSTFTTGNVLKEFHAPTEFQKKILENELHPLVYSEADVNEEKYKEQIYECFTDGFLGVASTLNVNDRVIWENRIGLQSNPMTLQQVADIVGLTRERVRQLLTKIFRKIENHPFWIDLDRRVHAHLHGRRSPISLRELSEIDPWFRGLSNLVAPLSEVSERLEILRFHILIIQDSTVISTINQSEWIKSLEDAKSLIKKIASHGLEESIVNSQIANIFLGRAEEMIEPLFEEVSKFMIWTSRSDGKKILSGYGNSLSTLILGILDGSEQPLHVEEILNLVQKHKGYESTNFRYAHNAASDVGILFNRGTFGLEKHCPINSDQMRSIRAEVEDMVFGGPSTKQWHCNEFYDELLLRGFSFDGKLTKYVINLALKESTYLVYLKRMIWGLRGQWAEGADSRLDVTQAIISLIEESGRPMSTLEIREKLESVRGLNVHFQIWASSPLVRLGPGTWGLEGRDVNMARINFFITKLLAELTKRQEGMHLSEIVLFLNLRVDDEVATIVSVGGKDGLRIDKGQYCYLLSWGNSRRISTMEAAISTLRENPFGLPRFELHAYVEKLIRRPLDKTILSSILQNTEEVVFDTVSGLWKYSREDSVD